jgi:hypothetical protein
VIPQGWTSEAWNAASPNVRKAVRVEADKIHAMQSLNALGNRVTDTRLRLGMSDAERDERDTEKMLATLAARRLREAIRLGEQMALTEARRMLAMKAQQARQIPG